MLSERNCFRQLVDDQKPWGEGNYFGQLVFT